MRLTGRLTQPQKIVVVIADSQGADPRMGLAGWLRLLIWLALTSLWALASIRVLRPSREEPRG
jgi:hypothetical protein